LGDLERLIEDTARSLGADLVGITNVERLAGGPPSADPRYVLPGARSVVTFALALEEKALVDFVTKSSWVPHCEDRKRLVRSLYVLAEAVTELLESLGYRAVAVDINNSYRPEPGAADVTEMTEFHPDFSHRYAAVAAGLGRIGWSGNLMTPQFGSRVELGSVITDAVLQPGEALPDADHPCDGCRACVGVCPVGMIPGKDLETVRVGGVVETVAHKRPNTCCWIGCTGYEGRSRSGTWSNWSPYRLGHPLPSDRSGTDALCISLQKSDPQMTDAKNAFADYRGAVFDPDWFYYTVCGFCRSVCGADHDGRVDLGRRIRAAGTTVLGLDGVHRVDPGDAVAVPTPFGVMVMVSRAELEALGAAAPSRTRADLFPLDTAVLEYLGTEAGRRAAQRATASRAED
jgi:epoxyqueuosine reductase